MSKSLNGRVAVVTGAARGIGQAIVRGLAAEGASIAGIDRLGCDETAAIATQAGADFQALIADVTDELAVGAAMDKVSQHFGRCDILINCAGILPRMEWDELDLAGWNRLIAVNATSQFLMCKAAIPIMRENSFGRIINFTGAIVQTPATGFIAYMASKMAVIGLTRGLATEMGPHGITVNAVSPSFVTTPGQIEVGNDPIQPHVTQQQAIKRDQVPEDIVGLITFLASEAAGFITAQTIHADGGLTYH